MNIRFPRERQGGLSIIELMVALLLASILTLGLVYVFVTNSQTFRLNEAQSRVQESGRTASDILSRAVRNADHWGCASMFADGGVDSLLNETADFESEFFLEGLAGEHDVDDGHADFADVLPGSDIVIFGGREGNAGLRMEEQFNPQVSAAVNVGDDAEDYFEVGDLILINDCRSANLLQISNFNNNGIVVNTGDASPGNESQIQNEFQSGASVFQPSRNSFYVRQTFDDDETERRSLVFNPRINSSETGTVGDWGQAVELVDNVWDMRIEFGRDTNDNSRVDTWSVPGPADEAEETISVRYSLLVRSPQDDVLEEPQSYCFPGWLDCQEDASLRTTSDDERLYRVYTATTSLRNRLE